MKALGLVLAMATVFTLPSITFFAATAVTQQDANCNDYDAITVNGHLTDCDVNETYRVHIRIEVFDSFLCPTIIDVENFTATITWDPCTPGDGSWEWITDTEPHNPNDGVAKGAHYSVTFTLEVDDNGTWLPVDSGTEYFAPQ